MTMKMSRIAFAVGALMAAGNASAVNEIFVGGASALRDTMPRFLNVICEDDSVSPREMYRFGSDSDRRAFRCKIKPEAVLIGLGLSGPTAGAIDGVVVTVFHSVEPGNTGIINSDADIGGSITGVIPLLYSGDPDAELNYLVLTGETEGGVSGSCATAAFDNSGFLGAETFSCTTQAKRHATEIGVSDVEPGKFSIAFGNLATSANVTSEWKSTPSDPKDLPQATIFAQPFVIAATDAAIAAGITNLSHDQLAAVLSGEVATWDRLGFASTEPVFVCRRTPGSGTQATFNARVSGRGCGNLSFLQQTTVGTQLDFSPNILENNTTGAVKACLVAADNANPRRLAIGILGSENVADELDWDIINYNSVDVWTLGEPGSVDGKVDNLYEDRIITGSYDLYVESTVQHRAGLAGTPLGFYNLIAEGAGLPSISLLLSGPISLASKAANSLAPNTLAGGHMFFSRTGDSCNASVFQP